MTHSQQDGNDSLDTSGSSLGPITSDPKRLKRKNVDSVHKQQILQSDESSDEGEAMEVLLKGMTQYC